MRAQDPNPCILCEKPMMGDSGDPFPVDCLCPACRRECREFEERVARDGLVVDPDHPAWIALDDDDWNGAAFWHWLRAVKDTKVVLRPEGKYPPEVVERLRAVISSHAKEVVVE